MQCARQQLRCGLGPLLGVLCPLTSPCAPTHTPPRPPNDTLARGGRAFNAGTLTLIGQPQLLSALDLGQRANLTPPLLNGRVEIQGLRLLNGCLASSVAAGFTIVTSAGLGLFAAPTTPQARPPCLPALMLARARSSSGLGARAPCQPARNAHAPFACPTSCSHACRRSGSRTRCSTSPKSRCWASSSSWASSAPPGPAVRSARWALFGAPSRRAPRLNVAHAPPSQPELRSLLAARLLADMPLCLPSPPACLPAVAASYTRMNQAWGSMRDAQVLRAGAYSFTLQVHTLAAYRFDNCTFQARALHSQAGLLGAGPDVPVAATQAARRSPAPRRAAPAAASGQGPALAWRATTTSPSPWSLARRPSATPTSLCWPHGAGRACCCRSSCATTPASRRRPSTPRASRCSPNKCRCAWWTGPATRRSAWRRSCGRRTPRGRIRSVLARRARPPRHTHRLALRAPGRVLSEQD